MASFDNLLFALTLLASLGCGLIAGLFFAFSVAVMRALARLPSAEGIAAMQSINVAIINPIFLAVFFGTAAACALVIIASLLRWCELGVVYLVLGSVLYLIGSFLVTVVFNVPKNNALASISPANPDSASLWANYLARWTAWNHVRTVAALAAMAFLIIGLCYWRT
ncbi:MAG: DUF1772 domain-containing protein [Planctomycetota bacterium]|nr:DUF1772 domain-containing protein [Planctomycetota bacterium]